MTGTCSTPYTPPKPSLLANGSVSGADLDPVPDLHLAQTLGVRSIFAQVGLVACASIEDKLDKVLRRRLLIPLFSADPEASNVASTS